MHRTGKLAIGNVTAMAAAMLLNSVAGYSSLCFPLYAQSPGPGPAFAVTSIEPSTPEENGYVRWFPGGRAMK